MYNLYKTIYISTNNLKSEQWEEASIYQFFIINLFHGFITYKHYSNVWQVNFQLDLIHTMSAPNYFSFWRKTLSLALDFINQCVKLGT